MKQYMKINWLSTKCGLLWLLMAVLPAISEAGDNVPECQREAVESGMISAADIQNYVDQCMPGQLATPGYDQEQPVAAPVYDQEQPVAAPVDDQEQPAAAPVYNQVQPVAPEPNIEQQYNPAPEYNAEVNYGGAESGEDLSED